MTKRRQYFVLAGALAVLTSGCASRYKADAQAPTYAAKAKIAVKTNRDGNRQMALTIDHLAPPERIDPRFRAYAVWIRVPGHGTTRAGVLKYNDRRRRGKLNATTPHSNFEVIVSLENNPSASAPSADSIVLRQVVGDNGRTARLGTK
ncbi:MAG: hypothetical protein JKY37_15835 [Nannocystaceae bacterium]|nr:hypothetical protein [Nannocystaceae bacterium]